MMKWESLLSLRKHGDTETRLRSMQDETRLGFEVDYDRIVFSAPFRSLQDKTQVIPLSKTDFVHTRLTHSLEVSVVGRSLGRLVGTQVLKKYPYLKEMGYQANDFGAIVASACLAHDIGNPPFGHSGEKAIGEYFSEGKGKRFKQYLNEKEWQDLVDFEGNANGFSVVSSSRPGIDGGLRLTYATLGAFMKYPKESLPKKPSKDVSDKKYGFFQADKAFFEEVATELGLSRKEGSSLRYVRHPLAFLVEAADDICYTIIDFEDGINLGLIPEDYALEYLTRIVKDNIMSQKYYALPSKEDRIAYMRALAIGSLIQDAVRVFMEQEELILEGNFPKSLLSKSQYKAQMEDVIQISVERVYNSREVIEKEVFGYRVIQTLLEKFVTAFENDYHDCASNYDKLLLKLLPERFIVKKETLYERLLHICHFISLLTDGNALLIYNTITAAK